MTKAFNPSHVIQLLQKLISDLCSAVILHKQVYITYSKTPPADHQPGCNLEDGTTESDLTILQATIGINLAQKIQYKQSLKRGKRNFEYPYGDCTFPKISVLPVLY